MWESMELGTAVFQTPTPGTMQECTWMTLCLVKVRRAHESRHSLASMWADNDDFWDGRANSSKMELTVGRRLCGRESTVEVEQIKMAPHMQAELFAGHDDDDVRGGSVLGCRAITSSTSCGSQGGESPILIAESRSEVVARSDQGSPMHFGRRRSAGVQDFSLLRTRSLLSVRVAPNGFEDRQNLGHPWAGYRASPLTQWRPPKHQIVQIIQNIFTDA